MTDVETDVAMVLALTRKNIPPEIQELLLFGNPMRGIPPGALRASFDAALAALNDAGYVVGPLNATLEMCRAGHRSDLLGCDIPDDECEMYYSRVYAAMLSAAQPAPK